jgi:hypothetical protein
MVFLEYILLAVLGSSGAAAVPGAVGSTSLRTLDAGTIGQPHGGSTEGSAPGSSLPGQDTGGDKARMSDSGKKATKTMARHHRRGHQRHHRAHAAKKGAKQ